MDQIPIPSGIKTGQVAKLSGGGIETLRFYERKGPIEERPRVPAGYRQYLEEVVTRIRFIKRRQELILLVSSLVGSNDGMTPGSAM